VVENIFQNIYNLEGGEKISTNLKVITELYRDVKMHLSICKMPQLELTTSQEKQNAGEADAQKGQMIVKCIREKQDKDLEVLLKQEIDPNLKEFIKHCKYLLNVVILYRC